MYVDDHEYMTHVSAETSLIISECIIYVIRISKYFKYLYLRSDLQSSAVAKTNDDVVGMSSS